MKRTLLTTLLVLAVLAGSAPIFAQNNADNAADYPIIPFDHATTGFDLIGSHGSVPCESCHVDGRFAGTPKQCVDCHSYNGRINASTKLASHIPTSEQCDACHQETFWDDVFHVDHTQAFGLCINCHNDFQAIGIQTVVDDPNLNHPNVPGTNCNLCHFSDVDWRIGNF